MYMTFNQFVEKYPWPTLCALRKIYYTAVRDNNYLCSAFKKIRGRLLIDPDKFFNIVEKQE